MNTLAENYRYNLEHAEDEDINEITEAMLKTIDDLERRLRNIRRETKLQ